MKLLKRTLCMLLVVCMSLSIGVQTFALQGDVNGDNKLTKADLDIMMKIVSGQIIPTKQQLSLADYNGDGKVNSVDISLVCSQCPDMNPKDNLKKFNQISPYTRQHTASKSKFCKVTEVVAETAPSSVSSDLSYPTYSAFPRGTFDYITGGPYGESNSKNSYYKLKSGRKVYTDEVSVFTGYNMPYNSAHLSKKVIYTQDSTNLYLALDWRVPFNVDVKPQSYVKGYSGKKFNLKDDEFTAQCVDITFFYTTSAVNNLTFPESDTIKSCRWIINKEKKIATLRIYMREVGGFYGFRTYYNKNNYLVISIKEPVDTLKGRVIMLDPGHGGVDSGALSQTGYYEKNITWPIANKLKALLESKGATVVLTRGNSSKEPTIQERRLKAIKENPDLYVAIHTDANPSRSANGCTVFYYKNYSAPLAYSISSELPKAVKSGAGYSLKNKGVNYYAFHVTRVDNCPSVLVETAFISNTNDFNMLKSAKGQDAIAKGLYNGIINYFNS